MRENLTRTWNRLARITAIHEREEFLRENASLYGRSSVTAHPRATILFVPNESEEPMRAGSCATSAVVAVAVALLEARTFKVHVG